VREGPAKPGRRLPKPKLVEKRERKRNGLHLEHSLKMGSELELTRSSIRGGERGIGYIFPQNGGDPRDKNEREGHHIRKSDRSREGTDHGETDTKNQRAEIE